MYKIFHGRHLVFACCVLVAMALGATEIPAQIVGDIEAKVLFAFSVENTRLPAGDYFTRPVQDSVSVLEMTSADNKVGVFLSPESADAKQLPKNSEMVFDKIGDHYFLREIWVEASSVGYRFPKSKVELRLEKTGTKTEQHRVTVKHNKGQSKKP